MRKTLALAGALALTMVFSSAAHASPTSTVSWQVYQRPTSSGIELTDRIQQVTAPGPTPGRPGGLVTRVELRPGDVTNTGGQLSNRAEAYGRAPTYMTSTPANQWPDPAGSVRWYSFSLYVPADFTFTSDGMLWESITQWKGYRGGSPPIALEIKRNGLRLGGARTNARLIPNDGNLGTITRGTWTKITVGMSLSPDPKVGWVEVWRDGRLALTRTAVATMDMINGQADPIYLKQGIYRDGRWAATHVLYFGPTEVGERLSDVA